MSFLLVFLAFGLVFIPCVEALLGPTWNDWIASTEATRERIGLLQRRMAVAVLGGGVLGLLAFRQIRMSPTSVPFFASHLHRCLGHTSSQGPGIWTLVTLVLSGGLLALVTVALFYPLPGVPEGERHPDLEEVLAGIGISARVECVPAAEPACVSEIQPAPRVVLLGGVEKLLSLEELEAVLLHEAGHLAHGDHRGRIWGRAFQRLLFFFPGGRKLFQALVHEQERWADEQALAWRPELRPRLRSAVLQLALGDFARPREGVLVPATLGVLGQEACSVKRRLESLDGKVDPFSLEVASRLWCLPGVVVFLFTLSQTGACTLHCLLSAMP